MQQGADRVLHNLLSDVDSLIKRAVGTAHPNKDVRYTDTLINTHLPACGWSRHR